MLKPVLLTWLAATMLYGQAPASSRVQSPSLGLIRMQDGSVHEVLGVPGSFVVGPALFHNARSVSYSGTAGLVALPDQLLLLDGNLNTIGTESIAHPVVVGITGDASTAIAYIPQEKTLLFWTGQSFSSLAATQIPEGTVWSVERQGQTATLFVDDLKITVSLETGNLVDCHAMAASSRLGWSHLLHQAPASLTLEQMNSRDWHILSNAAATTTWVGEEQPKRQVWELPAAKDNQ